MAWAEVYLHAKFHLDLSNRLATIHQRYGLTDRIQRSDSIGRNKRSPKNFNDFSIIIAKIPKIPYSRNAKLVAGVTVIVYPMHLIDPVGLVRFFPSVCVFVNRSVLERLRPQFFTDFHQILHAAQKCGRFDAYCL